MLLTNISNAQENKLKSKLIDGNYTWGTASKEQIDSYYFDLTPIQTTKFKSHFRISLKGQIIDIYYTDNKIYKGKLTNYTTEYIYVKNKNTGREEKESFQSVFEQIDLEQSKIETVVEKLITTKLPEVPTDSLITLWKQSYLHCNSLAFQYAINGKYFQQIFHCPWWQNDSVEYKSTVLENYLNIKSTFQLDSLYKNFQNKLPNGKTYSRDGYIMMYKMTDKQQKKWNKNKPKRDYMESIKDTVDKYIEVQIKKQEIKSAEIDCFGSYKLIIGKNGKLKKITIQSFDKPKLEDSLGEYLADKKEIRKCKKKIKQIFTSVDLGFLKLETQIFRTLIFGSNNQVILRDDTAY